MKDRVILHSDLNAFYASVECMENPALRGNPVAVVGDSDLRHGIVLAKNEEAKRCGIKTGHVIWEAKNLCPELITVKGNFDKYCRVSERVRKIYDSYTDRVESFGIDECWLDISGSDGKKTADEIRERIKFEVGITASIGVSWNKIYAKLGSDLKKPDATVLINRENYKQKIFDLPAEYLLHVGRATKARLEKYNIKTIGDITLCSLNFFKDKFGKCGEYIWMFASGLDGSLVSRSSEDTQIKSVGNSTTTVRDLKNINEILTTVTVLSDSVAARMRKKGLKGEIVHLDVVDKFFKHFSKQIKISAPTNASDVIVQTAMRLFNDFYEFKNPVRSVGVRMSGIIFANTPVQISFFDEKKEKLEHLEYALDKIRSKFGKLSISRALELSDKRLSGYEIKEENEKYTDIFHGLSSLP